MNLIQSIFGEGFSLVVGITGAVLALILVVIIIVKRYRIAEPDEAIIVTGGRGKTTVDPATGRRTTDLSGQKVVQGGGVFVLPFIQKAFVLSLRSRRLTINTTAQTKSGITINAQAVAVIKVGGTEEMIRAAAQRFLSQQEEIETSTQEVLSGSLRGIIGTLDVTDIIRDRATLASAVLSASEEALSKQGLIVDTLQIQGINDDQGYIENLGKPEAANVRREAEIADVNATRASQEARIAADKVLVDANRELSLRQAAVQAETDKANAEAEAAQPLEAAIQRQRIVEQQEITAVKEAQLKEQVLNAEVRKVADAEAYRVTTTATAAATARVAAANAAKEERIAFAEAIAAEGIAEAGAISARGIAEASAIEARADALAEQSAALLAQELIQILPLVAEQFGRAYADSNMTIISADGTQQVSRDMVGGMATMTTMLRDATGIDIAAIINSSAQGNALGSALGKAPGSSRVNKQATKLDETSAPLTPPVPVRKTVQPLPVAETPAPPVKLKPANKKLDEVIEETFANSGIASDVLLEEIKQIIPTKIGEPDSSFATGVVIPHAKEKLNGLEGALQKMQNSGLGVDSLEQTNIALKTKAILSQLNKAGINVENILKDYPLTKQVFGF